MDGMRWRLCALAGGAIRVVTHASNCMGISGYHTGRRWKVGSFDLVGGCISLIWGAVFLSFGHARVYGVALFYFRICERLIVVGYYASHNFCQCGPSSHPRRVK